jgi:protein-L-isoaspartate(D-aspartate) O-methyltransferase
MNYEEQRHQMVSTQLLPRQISEPLIIKAFKKVPREKFVPSKYIEGAYGDYPLPIGEGQTISQPFMVALMTQALGLTEETRVLEVGTGSGYQAAILAEIAKEVFTIERFPKLSERAQSILKKLGYKNIYFKIGDGTCGWPDYSPYQAIIVTAGAPRIPPPLIEQLQDGGRLVIPVGGVCGQTLICVHKTPAGLKEEKICGCVFVPLVGKFGWENDDRSYL